MRHYGHLPNTVRAVVKNVLAFGDGSSSDASLDGFVPPDPEHFGFFAQVFVGDDVDDRSDSFDLVVCSPSWFAEEAVSGRWEQFRGGGLTVLPESIAVGSGIWFMRRWDKAAFEDALKFVCDAASPGPDWGTVAARIGRLIPWEFAYKYDERVNQENQ